MAGNALDRDLPDDAALTKNLYAGATHITNAFGSFVTEPSAHDLQDAGQVDLCDSPGLPVQLKNAFMAARFEDAPGTGAGRAAVLAAYRANLEAGGDSLHAYLASSSPGSRRLAAVLTQGLAWTAATVAALPNAGPTPSLSNTDALDQTTAAVPGTAVGTGTGPAPTAATPTPTTNGGTLPPPPGLHGRSTTWQAGANGALAFAADIQGARVLVLAASKRGC